MYKVTILNIKFGFLTHLVTFVISTLINPCLQ